MNVARNCIYLVPIMASLSHAVNSLRATWSKQRSEEEVSHQIVSDTLYITEVN